MKKANIYVYNINRMQIMKKIIKLVLLPLVALTPLFYFNNNKKNNEINFNNNQINKSIELKKTLNQKIKNPHKIIQEYLKNIKKEELEKELMQIQSKYGKLKKEELEKELMPIQSKYGKLKKEELEKELMQIQSKYGKICLIVLSLILLLAEVNLLVYSGVCEIIINFVKNKINNKIDEYKIEKIRAKLPEEYQDIDIILEKDEEQYDSSSS